MRAPRSRSLTTCGRALLLALAVGVAAAGDGAPALPRLIRVAEPADGSHTSMRFSTVRVELTDLGRDLQNWMPWGAVEPRDVRLCLTFVRERFFYKREHPAERVRQCLLRVGAGGKGLLSQFPVEFPRVVELPIECNYTVIAEVVHGGDGDGDGGVVKASARSSFGFGPDPACRDRLLRGGSGAVWVDYNTAAEEGRSDWDVFHDHRMSPLCMDDATAARYTLQSRESLGQFLNTASGFRGTFGVDHTAQEFGHGDAMMLHYVLSRHRDEFDAGSNFVELGCFAGVTSLTLGVAASLRSLDFHAFDVSDFRPDSVKRTWLSNMHHHVVDVDLALGVAGADGGGGGDAAAAASREDFRRIIRIASLVMVDHDHQTRLEAAVELGKVLRRDRPVIVLVHDFPAGKPLEEWTEAMHALGFELMYSGLRDVLVSSLATFRRGVEL